MAALHDASPVTEPVAHHLGGRHSVRNRLIPFNPADEVRIPRARQHDTGERIISRDDFRRALLPAVPSRHRAIVATAGGAGLRWGEAAGLWEDALDLDGARLSVIRTVIEVGGHTSFKPFPKSRAGRRTVPLPAWLVEIIREHLREWLALAGEPLFANEVGAPLRRTLFRSRIWRPSLVRAGLLGAIAVAGDKFEAHWTDATGAAFVELLPTRAQAVQHVARHQAGGLWLHDLRHSYATWLVDDGVPPNTVQRVMGHERSTTTLDLCTRRTDNSGRILQALDDNADGGGQADAEASAPSPLQ